MGKFKKIAKIIIPIAVILYVIYHAKTELASISIREALHTIHQLSSGELTLLVILGIISVFAMAFYDTVLISGLGLSIPYKKVLRIGFIASSLNIVLGFGGLAGATVRHAVYKTYTNDTRKLLAGITWTTTATLMGLSMLSIGILVHLIPGNHILDDKPWLLPVLVGMGLFLPLYFVLSFVNEKKQPDKRTFKSPMKTNTLLSIVSLIEWLCAASILYLLLELFHIDTSYLAVLGVFVIASIVGVISFVPGGVGSFDLTFLIGMSYYGFNEETILSVILVYRIVYYFIPFLISLLLTVLEFSSTTLRKIESKPIIGPALETTGVVWALYRELLAKLWDWAICIVLFVLAWVNIASVLILPFQTPLLTKEISNICYDFIFLFAVIILLNLRGIFNRTKKAFVFVLISLSGSFIAFLLKAFDYQEAIISASIICILIIVRKQFQMERVLVSFFNFLFSIALGGSVVGLYYVLGTSITTVENASFFRGYPQILETSVFAIICVPLFLGIGTYIFNRIRIKDLGIPFDRNQFHSFLENYTGNSLTHLGYMADKRMYFSSNGKALILFRKYKNRLIVLGDPSGEYASYPLVLDEFMQEATNYGYLVVFYQIDQSTMHLYHEFGYRFFKLGEEACVPLSSFSISGKKQSNFRANYNRFQREGYTFTIHDHVTTEQLNEMEVVSNKWLGKRSEKGFSMGVFCRKYISESPVCLVRDQEGKLLAFATMMPAYDNQKISIDLMRHLPDAPAGTMDTLFLHLIFWAKEQDYQTFNLGMAPLANVGTQNESFLAERIAGTIFNNVRYMYSFSGLRQYKGKYHPQWQGKYLAYRKNKTLFASIIWVTRMIGKGNPKIKHTKTHKQMEKNKQLTG